MRKGPGASTAGVQLGGVQLGGGVQVEPLAMLGGKRRRAAGPRPPPSDALGRSPEHRRLACSSAACSSRCWRCGAASGSGPPSTRWRRSMRKGPGASAAGVQLSGVQLGGGGQVEPLAMLCGKRRRAAGPRPPAGDALEQRARSIGNWRAARRRATWRRRVAGGAGEAVQPAAAAGGPPSTCWRRSRATGPEHRSLACNSAAAYRGRHRSRGWDQQSAGSAWLASSSPAASTAARGRVCSQQQTRSCVPAVAGLVIASPSQRYRSSGTAEGLPPAYLSARALTSITA